MWFWTLKTGLQQLLRCFSVQPNHSFCFGDRQSRQMIYLLLQFFTPDFSSALKKKKSTFLIIQNVLKFAICFPLSIYRVCLTSGAHYFWHWLIHSPTRLPFSLILALFSTVVKQRLPVTSQSLLTFWASSKCASRVWNCVSTRMWIFSSHDREEQEYWQMNPLLQKCWQLRQNTMKWIRKIYAGITAAPPSGTHCTLCTSWWEISIYHRNT